MLKNLFNLTIKDM